MANELKNLSTLFNGRVFRIPDYQRGYSWGQPQLADFWKDLHRIPAGKSHYAGLISLEPVRDWSKWDGEGWLVDEVFLKPYYIVDGQQRMTTAIILLKCILDRCREDEELARTPRSELITRFLVRKSRTSSAFVFGYEVDNPSYEYFKTRILGETSLKDRGTETTYTANLWYARAYFERMLSQSELSAEEIFRRLSQRLLFNEHEIQDDLDVFVAFETMNNRGKSLSKLELLKNRLIYLSTLVDATEPQKADLRTQINDAWKTIYESLGKSQERPLDDDDFLRAHWIMYFTYARAEAQQFASFLLERHFTAERVEQGKLTAEDLQSYVKSLAESVAAWYCLHFPEHSQRLSDPIRKQLERFARIGWGAFRPLLMACLTKRVSEEDLAAFLAESERFVFLIFKLCRRRSDTGDSRFYSAAGSIFRDEASLAEITDQVVELVNEYYDTEDSIREIGRLFKEQSGFYSWSGLRFFLFEYEQHLKERARSNTEKIDWRSFSDSKKDHGSIEHIYPQTPVDSQWPRFSRVKDENMRYLLNGLGNLLALAPAKNSAFQNKRYSEKSRSAEGKRGYHNGSYSEIQVANEFSEWTPQSILKRGLDMVEFMRRRWEIPGLETRQSQVRFLHLEFVRQ